MKAWKPRFLGSGWCLAHLDPFSIIFLLYSLVCFLSEFHPVHAGGSPSSHHDEIWRCGCWDCETAMLTAKLWNMLWNLEKKKCVWFILVSRNQLRISPMEPPIPVSNVGRCLCTASPQGCACFDHTAALMGYFISLFWNSVCCTIFLSIPFQGGYLFVFLFSLVQEMEFFHLVRLNCNLTISIRIYPYLTSQVRSDIIHWWKRVQSPTSVTQRCLPEAWPAKSERRSFLTLDIMSCWTDSLLPKVCHGKRRVTRWLLQHVSAFTPYVDFCKLLSLIYIYIYTYIYIYIL